MKVIFIALVFSLNLVASFLSHAQELKSDDDKGKFLVKCYAAGIHVMVNDAEITPDLKARIQKWALNVGSVAEKYVDEEKMKKMTDSELFYLAKISKKGYLHSQLDKCIKVLGRW